MVHRSIRCLSHGAGHCIAVSDTGVVFTWGAGVCGQLGHNEQVCIADNLRTSVLVLAFLLTYV